MYGAGMNEGPRDALVRLARERGTSLSALSRMIGRNVAYLGQYAGRGTPRVLPERERALLADFFAVDETMLGAPGRRGAGDAAIPYLDVAASAGPGALAGAERMIREIGLSAAGLRAMGIDPALASLIRISGDSMSPQLCEGDRLLVDRGDRRVPAAGGVFVVRVAEALSVKRVVPRGASLELRSDNPAYPPRTVATRDAEVIGRARLALRDVA